MAFYRNGHKPMVDDVVVRTSIEMDEFWRGKEATVQELLLGGEVVKVAVGDVVGCVDTNNMRLRRRGDGTVPENAG